MKYLKITVSLFAVTLVLSLVGVSAETYNINNIKIPIFSGVYTTAEKAKMNFNNQYVKKTKAVDDWSGDGRAISAKVHGKLTGMYDTAWTSIPQNKNVMLDNNSTVPGSWELKLRSDKSLASTATFSGVWTIE